MLTVNLRIAACIADERVYKGLARAAVDATQALQRLGFRVTCEVFQTTNLDELVLHVLAVTLESARRAATELDTAELGAEGRQ